MAEPGVTSGRLIRFFQAISQSADYAVLLGGATDPTPLNRWALMGVGARQVLRLSGKTLQCITPEGARQIACDDAETLFAEYRAALAWAKTYEEPDFPFHGGLMGVFGYGFYPWCDVALFDHAGALQASAFPDALLVECRDWLIFDLTRPDARPRVLSASGAAAAAYQARWQKVEAGWLVDVAAENPENWQPSLMEADFDAQVACIQEHIRAGDLYQANLSIRFQQTLSLDPFAVFGRLCARNPSPFSGMFKFPEGWLVCNSPERLVSLDPAGVAEARPIAGTRGRGRTEAEDVAIGDTLLSNEKERAEHLMLVDLERNDLGRVCAPGSVSVSELMALERYSHVTHLVSNVRGQLQVGRDAWDLLTAMFPGGTITGCPKIRCSELLRRYEPVPRGWYTGSLGYFDALTGAMDLNILIRSLYLEALEERDPAGSLVYNAAVHAGAGIVADSVGPHEYRECRRKLQALLDALQSSKDKRELTL